MSTATVQPIRRGPFAPLSTPLDWRVRLFAWLSFLAEVLIIGTGGAVRLTDSGLGCSEWPLCTPGSLVPTEALGVHGLIEFGNRTLTGLVGMLALVVLVLTFLVAHARRELRTTLWFALAGVVGAAIAYAIARITPAADWAFSIALAVALVICIVAAVVTVRSVVEHRDLVILAWIVFVGIVAQAFVGGITVLTGLNPFIVGFHYTSSLLLVCVTAAYLVRLAETDRPRVRAVPGWFSGIVHLSTLVLAVTIAFGVLTTGSGPHSGDAEVIRKGFDATLLAHIHSWPGYALFALTIVLLAVAWIKRLRPRRWLTALLIVLLVQIAVGIWQARNGLPAVLVGIHMVLAALSAAVFTVVVLRLKEPVPEG